MIISNSGEVKSDAEAQEMVHRTIQRTGRFIISSPNPVTVGECFIFVGLPFRVVRLTTLEEARKDQELTPEWGPVDSLDSLDYYYEVEVAD